MSYQFDKSEVPRFEQSLTKDDAGFTTQPCVACQEIGHIDHMTGLCRPCWRIVVLGPAMENQ